MANRTSILIQILIVIIVVAVMGVIGMQVTDPEFKQQISENRAQFESFCTDLYGDDAHVYAGGSYGDHTGLHCAGGPGEGVIHQGQIPDDVWNAYLEGEVSAEYVATQLEPVQGLFSILFRDIVPITIIIGIIVLILGMFQRYRGNPA